jgi:hypothetical protein
MGSIDQPVEVLGAMIGGALVGTFMGVLLSYCIVGPLAAIPIVQGVTATPTGACPATGPWLRAMR